MRIALILATAAAVASHADAAPFTNGSFETAPFHQDGFTELFTPPNNTTIPGWTVAAGSVDWISTYWNASAGASSIDLSGRSAGTLTQTFVTSPGATYTVQFDLAGNPDGGQGTRNLGVSTDGVTFTPYSFTVGATNTRTDMGWLTQLYSFTATQASTTLTFRSNENTVFGPALDNVSVTAAVPEPATLAVFGGIALAGALGYRRRKANSNV